MPDAAAATTGASVLRSGIWSVASKSLPQLFGLAVSITGARILGASGFGRQSYIAFVAASVIYLLGLGIPLSVMRQVGESVGAGRAMQARGLVRWSWRFAFAGSIVGFVAILVVALSGARPEAAWVLAAFIVAIGVLTQIPDAVISGLQRWRDSSIIVLCASGLGTVTTVAVLEAGGGITGMVAVQLAVSCGIFAAMMPIARRRLGQIAPGIEDPGALRGRTLRYAGSVITGSLFTLVVFRRSELFFLDHYGSSRDIALYSVAFSLMSALVLIPQSLATVVAPAVATIFGGGQTERIRSGYSRALRLLLLVGLPVVAAGLILGPELLTVMFGRAFRGSRIPLLILLAPFPLIPLMNATFSLIVGLGKMRFPLVAGAGTVALNVTLDLALIPHYHVNGAAIANASAQGVTAITILFYGVRLVGGVRWHARSLVRMLLCSFSAGAAAWGVLSVLKGGAGGLVAGAAAGLAVFVTVASFLGVLPGEDARWLGEEFGSALGGAVGRVVRRLEVR